MLTEAQKAFYAENGYLKAESVLTAEELSRAQSIVTDWIEGSRSVTESDELYDLDKGHSAETPRLTRVKLPHRNDPFFWQLLTASRVTEVLNDLLGPSTIINTSKLNCKAPGGGAAVRWRTCGPRPTTGPQRTTGPQKTMRRRPRRSRTAPRPRRSTRRTRPRGAFHAGPARPRP